MEINTYIVYLKLTKKYDSKDPNFADLRFEGTVYHGNYQGCRS